METAPIIAVEVPLLGDERHKNWAKVVYDVDTSSTSGWAFQGEFIAAGAIQDVPAGSVIMVYGERGSRGNPQIEARVYVAHPDGVLTEQGMGKGRGWARTLRDTVAELLSEENSGLIVDLSGYTDTMLIDELELRGYKITKGE